MKKIKLFLTVCLFAVSTSASAQFANSSTQNAQKNTFSKNLDSWDKLTISYDMPTLNSKEGSKETYSGNGISIAWGHGFNISKNLPLFLELGAGISYSGISLLDEEYDDESYTIDLSYLYINVPVNLTYKFSVGENFHILPYAGLGVRVGLLADGKAECSYYDESESETYSYYDKDVVGESMVFNRFLAGYQVGVNFNVKKFTFGVGYQGDFIEISEKKNYGAFSINLGIVF